jgi:hypothetical protein
MGNILDNMETDNDKYVIVLESDAPAPVAVAPPVVAHVSTPGVFAPPMAVARQSKHESAYEQLKAGVKKAAAANRSDWATGGRSVNSEWSTAEIFEDYVICQNIIENKNISDVTMSIVCMLIRLMKDVADTAARHLLHDDQYDFQIQTPQIGIIDAPEIESTRPVDQMISFIHELNQRSKSDDVYLVLMYMYIKRAADAPVKPNKPKISITKENWKYVIVTYSIIARKAWSHNTNVRTRDFVNVFTNTNKEMLRKYEKDGLEMIDNNIKVNTDKYGELLLEIQKVIKKLYDSGTEGYVTILNDSVISYEFRNLAAAAAAV